MHFPPSIHLINSLIIIASQHGVLYWSTPWRTPVEYAMPLNHFLFNSPEIDVSHRNNDTATHTDLLTNVGTSRIIIIYDPIPLKIGKNALQNYILAFLQFMNYRLMVQVMPRIAHEIEVIISIAS